MAANSLAESNLLLLLFSLSPLLFRYLLGSDEQTVVDISLLVVCTFVLFLFIKIPWQLFENCGLRNGGRDERISAIQILAFALNVCTPFFASTAVNYLKREYNGRSSILQWINTDLLVCVCLSRPLLFLMGKKNRMPPPEDVKGDQQSEILQLRGSVAQQQERISQLENQIRIFTARARPPPEAREKDSFLIQLVQFVFLFVPFSSGLSQWMVSRLRAT